MSDKLKVVDVTVKTSSYNFLSLLLLVLFVCLLYIDYTFTLNIYIITPL